MLALIVARDENGVIGKDGRIPWKIKGEMKRFRELTTGNAVIMGRRTYEEIGRPLPNRTTVVVSRTGDFSTDNCLTARSLSEALALCEGKDAYVAGGAALYREAIPLVDRMYITEIHAAFEGDTFFPAFDPAVFEKTEETLVDGEIPYTYTTYIRKK